MLILFILLLLSSGFLVDVDGIAPAEPIGRPQPEMVPQEFDLLVEPSDLVDALVAQQRDSAPVELLHDT